MITPFLELKKVYLSVLSISDVNQNWTDWLNNSNITQYQDKQYFPQTLEKQERYFSNILNSSSDLLLAIRDKESNLHIGNVGLHDIDYIHRRCNIGVVIGNSDYWNKGIATDVIRGMVHHAFYALNLNRVTATIMSENIGSISAFKKCNFILEGTLVSFFYKNGSYRDAFIYSILRDDKDT
jgi:RimJ/RimL family protein N-acetyltransferase